MMSKYRFVKSMPDQALHISFEKFPERIYEANSPRFILGHDPKIQFLEGCYLMYADDQPVGRFALYNNPFIKFDGYKTLLIGSYECINDVSISDSLLAFAKATAKQLGAEQIIGPMEGSTWNNYRFSNNNDHPNFFMEPYHHVFYNHHFTNAGFESIATYLSNLGQTDCFDKDFIQSFEEKYRNEGYVIRNIDLADFKNEITKIGELSITGFAGNFLYSPISIDQFVDKYEKIKPYLDPQLIWLIEGQNETLQAFVFGIKDYNDSTNKTLIFKSMVRSPHTKLKGAGYYLSSKLIEKGHVLGYTQIIHALMIADNASVGISKGHSGKPYKSYSLYRLKL